MIRFRKWLESQYINTDGEIFWAGEGNGASGILPIAQNTKRICLAWRSGQVHIGNCWGTFGGAIMKGMNSSQSAIEEMKEETGYNGPISLKPAYIFKRGNFSYYNFIGIVNNEFSFSPEGGHSWETDHIQWFAYPEVFVQKNRFHPGLTSLFENSKELIEQIVNI